MNYILKLEGILKVVLFTLDKATETQRPYPTF